MRVVAAADVSASGLNQFCCTAKSDFADGSNRFNLAGPDWYARGAVTGGRKMSEKEEKRREILLRRLERVDQKVVRLKKVLARLQAHLKAVTAKKTAA